MPQNQLPIFPAGVTPITPVLAFSKQDGRVTYCNGPMPVLVHDEEDLASFQMITAQFCVNGNARQADIVRAFGVTKVGELDAVAPDFTPALDVPNGGLLCALPALLAVVGEERQLSMARPVGGDLGGDEDVVAAGRFRPGAGRLLALCGILY